MTKKGYIELYSEKGEFLGVFVETSLWMSIKNKLPEILGEKKNNAEIKEPLEDWELFKKCWDFKYPYDFSVRCSICGNETENWETDGEKRFFLTAASVSGLVSFRCAKCNAKIIKKHFKDKIVTESIPFKEK